MENVIAQLNNLNWWAVLLATASTLPVGFAWYNNAFGFGRSWEKAAGLTKNDLASTKKRMPAIFARWITQSLILTIVLGCIMRALGVQGFYDSLLFGLVVGILVRGSTHIGNDGFENAPGKLTWINIGQDAASTAVIVLILGMWR